MNNLRNCKAYLVGKELLDDNSLGKFQAELNSAIENFTTSDVVKVLRKIQRKLETLESCFSFSKA